MAEVHFTLLSRCVPGFNGCIIWIRCRNANGYGQIRIRGKGHLAHRISYRLSVGEIPDGMHVCHRCDNPSCINPDHLFLGTAADNMQDKKRKGRARGGEGMNHRNRKLNAKQVLEIKADSRLSPTVAKEYGISQLNVRRIRSGLIWRCLNGEKITAPIASRRVDELCPWPAG